MIRNTIIILALFFILEANARSLSDREKQQIEYDRACEQARTNKIAPLKIKYIKECVEKWKKEQEYCERFYSTYGDAASGTYGGRKSLFYDLPECERAFKYKKSYRQ